MEVIQGVPPWLGAAIAIASALAGWWSKNAWEQWRRTDGLHARGWDRVQTLEKTIDLLRIALNKGLVRENALVTVCEILLMLIATLDQSDPRIAEAKARAREIMERALRSTQQSGGGGQ